MITTSLKTALVATTLLAIAALGADVPSAKAAPRTKGKARATAKTTRAATKTRVAQGKRAATQPGTNARTRAKQQGQKDPPRRMKQITFGEGSTIEGGVDGPDGTTITGRSDLIHSNLIRIRRDFLREIHKSAERL